MLFRSDFHILVKKKCQVPSVDISSPSKVILKDMAKTISKMEQELVDLQKEKDEDQHIIPIMEKKEAVNSDQEMQSKFEKFLCSNENKILTLLKVSKYDDRPKHICVKILDSDIQVLIRKYDDLRYEEFQETFKSFLKKNRKLTKELDSKAFSVQVSRWLSCFALCAVIFWRQRSRITYY